MRKTACFGWLLFLGLSIAREGSAQEGSAQEFQISAGADDCSMPPMFGGCIGGTFTDPGSTVGANNTVGSVNGGCSVGTGVSGPDVVYHFSHTGVSTPVFELRVTPSAGFDVAIYLASSCPTGPNASIATCITGADAGGPGVPEVISHATLLALPVGPYFLWVDSSASGAASSGTYVLALGPGVCPVELMDYSVE